MFCVRRKENIVRRSLFDLLGQLRRRGEAEDWMYSAPVLELSSQGTGGLREIRRSGDRNLAGPGLARFLSSVASRASEESHPNHER